MIKIYFHWTITLYSKIYKSKFKFNANITTNYTQKLKLVKIGTITLVMASKPGEKLYKKTCI
jgi:hypothetical protein